MVKNKMIIFISILFISGFFLYNIIEKNKKISNMLIFSLLLGIGYHTVFFIILSLFNIYYFKSFFLITSISIIILNLATPKYRLVLLKYEKDLKEIPIYYILFIVYLLYRFYVITSTSLVNYYNWDEIAFYQFIPREIFFSHDFSRTYLLFAPVNYFFAGMSFEFVDVTLQGPRILGGILYVLIGLIIFISLKNEKVNKHIAALLSMIFLISSGEAFLYYRSFYNNVIYAVFLIAGLYYVLKHYFIDNKKTLPILGFVLIFFSVLTRREPIFHIIIFLFLLFIILIIQKKITLKKSVILLTIPSLFGGLCAYISSIRLSDSVGPTVGQETVNMMTKFESENLESFFNFTRLQYFSFNEHFCNYLMTISFIIALVLVIRNIWQYKKKKTDLDWFSIFAIVIQLIYLAIVLATMVALFTMREWLVAASFSRYMISVFPINFIIIGIMLFKNKKRKVI